VKNKNFDTAKDIHKTGIGGLWLTYGSWRFIIKPSFWFAFVAALVFQFILGQNDKSDSYDLIKKLSDIGISLEGSLVGLSLAGLTLIVTFGSERLLKRLVKDSIKEDVKNRKGYNFSGYQTVVSKFGFAVLVQIIALIVLFGYSLIAQMNLSFDNEKLNILFNKIYFFFGVFLVLYSLFLLIQMTINIFNISQMNHAVIYNESTKEVFSEINGQKQKQKYYGFQPKSNKREL